MILGHNDLLDIMDHSNAPPSDVRVATTSSVLLLPLSGIWTIYARSICKLDSDVKLKGSDVLQGKQGSPFQYARTFFTTLSAAW